MELTSSPFGFEILQIESCALLFVLAAMVFAAWRSFRDGGAQIQNPGALVGLAGLLVAVLSSGFVYALGFPQFLFAVELALGFLLALTCSANALAFFVCLQFLRPWEVIVDNPLLLSLPRVSGLLAIGSAVTSYLRHRQRLRFGLAQWLLLAFGTWTFATTLFTPNPVELQTEFFDSFFRALVMFFLIVVVVRKAEDVELLRRVYVASVSALACVSIYVSWDEIFGEAGGGRLHAVGAMENSNDIAAIMVMGIPFALRRLSQGSRQPLVWIESLFILSITFVALYLAQSRGALLALGASGVGWWFLRSKRKLLVACIGLACVGAVAPFANELMRRDAEDLHESGASRITYWKAGVRMAIKSPVVGVGYNRYPIEYQSNAGGGEQFEFGERTAHSTWVLALAETGVPGFLLFMGFILSGLRMAKRVVRHEPDLFVALIAYLIAISFLSHTYVSYLYILMGLVVAAYRLHYRTEKGWQL